jgi:hypothetical protein
LRPDQRRRGRGFGRSEADHQLIDFGSARDPSLLSDRLAEAGVSAMAEEAGRSRRRQIRPAILKRKPNPDEARRPCARASCLIREAPYKALDYRI